MWKIINMHVKNPPIWNYNITQGYMFLYLERPLFDLCITEFAQNFFNRMLEKWGFWQSYLSLKCSFLVHFNEIITQCTNMIWKILSFLLDSDSASSQIKLSKLWVFPYYVSPTAWFCLTFNDVESVGLMDRL